MRSAPLKNVTPLTTRTELRRATPLARTPFRSPRTALTASSPGRRGAEGRRDTGPSAKTRAAVYAREGNQCAACGLALGDGAWRSIQHRVRRQVGGNGLSNLVLLCGSATSPGCHRKAEDRGDDMHARGFWLRADEDPAQVPIMLAGADGGMTVWLTADGGYSTTAPGVAS